MPNVMEPWAIYDTIIICPQLYGNEANCPGWFTSIAAFGAQQEHRFFKNRNRALCGLAYNNQMSSDRADFAFHAVSMGLAFFGPCTPNEYDSNRTVHLNPYLAPFFQFDLPHHIAASLRLGQDVRLEASGYHVPPGYGPVIGGMSPGLDTLLAGTNGLNQGVFAGTQGIAAKENRFVFDTEIGIPRNETFEVKISVSEWARKLMTHWDGPGNYTFSQDIGEGTLLAEFPVRYGIQCSLYGMREVQQRGAAHM